MTKTMRESQDDAGTVVFVPLAIYHTRFYLRIAETLRTHGYRVAFISFHETSNELIRAEGYESFNPFEAAALAKDYSLAEIDGIVQRFAIPNLPLLLSHEKEFYGTRGTAPLAQKLARYVVAVDGYLQKLRSETDRRIYVLQELGGFVSVASVFYAARRLDIDNVFMEPSFFRGRAFFTANTYRAPQPPPPRSPSREVIAYLEAARSSAQIVIPVKDAAHYQSATRKIMNRRNVRRLFEKTFEKHVLGRNEEFSHIGHHVRKHVSMLVNAKRLRPLARRLADAGRFVYYPLHVPADVALTIRAPEYLDQFALIDYIARSVPLDCRVAFKEHPALIGAIDPSRVRELLDRHDNLIMLDPRLNNHQVMKAAAAIVTVNSKSGAEAIMLNRPVVALGDSFYCRSPLVQRTAAAAELPDAIDRALTQPPHSDHDIESFFQAVWERSSPGEMFDLDTANCERFTVSLLTVLDTMPAPPVRRVS